MATNNEEVVIGLSRCVVRALVKVSLPRDIQQLLDDLKFQIIELDEERRSMNNGTWRHKEDETQPKQKEYTMEPTKIVEAISEVRKVESYTPAVTISGPVPGSNTSVEKFLRSLKIATQNRRAARLALAGLSNFAIGNLLGITEASVKHHLEAVFKSAGVSNRACFAAIAFGYDVEAASKLNDSDPLTEADLRKYVGAAKRSAPREEQLGI